MTELKPCPFCGSKNVIPILLTEVISVVVFCNNCFARGPRGIPITTNSTGQEEAQKAWNKRAATIIDEDAVIKDDYGYILPP